MWEKTITVSSCGKTFSVTGWQVGWMIGPRKYVSPVQEIIPCVQFCASTPIQTALSLAIPSAQLPYQGYSTYYEWLRSQFQNKRILLEKGLRSAGIEPLPSRGGFFLLAKLPTVSSSILETATQSDYPYDWKYCLMLAKSYGVVGIPASPFFQQEHSQERLLKLGPMARFAFCKTDETIQIAAQRLETVGKVV
jgi:kynurenine--oxoglutarate transaminase/cysteine-S-conjugate beta-lyase/glutamine--phenylpyruvate transaminase